MLQHRPLGYKVPFLTCAAGILTNNLSHLQAQVTVNGRNWRVLSLCFCFFQAAHSCLYLCYHRLQLHCLKLSDSQWFLCLCMSVYLDFFVFLKRHTSILWCNCTTHIPNTHAPLHTHIHYATLSLSLSFSPSSQYFRPPCCPSVITVSFVIDRDTCAHVVY